jgi:predicted small metal-binding protein
MQQQVSCECGFQARENNEDALVKVVLEHVNGTHPDLVDHVTPDVVRGWIELVP